MAAPAGALAPVQSGAPDYYTRCLRIDNAVGHLIVGFLDSQELGTIGDKGTILAVNRVTQKYFAAGFRFQKEGPVVTAQEVDIVLRRFPDARSLTIKASQKFCIIQPSAADLINRLVALTIRTPDHLVPSSSYGILPCNNLDNLLTRSPNLTSLKVIDDISSVMLPHFSKAVNLTEVDLSGCFHDYADYSWLKKLPSLVKLVLPSGTSMPNHIIAEFFSFNGNITHLDCRNTPINDHVVFSIGRNLTQLRHFTMPPSARYQCSDGAFATLRGASLLESLRLNKRIGTEQPSQMLMALQDFPLLTHLSAPETELYEEAFTPLADSPSIRSLSLEACENSDEELLNLRRMRKLESLNLLNSNVAVQTIRAIVLAHQEHLRFLAISCPLSKDDLVYLLTTAKKLEVLHCTLHDDQKEESVEYVNYVNITLPNRSIYVHPVGDAFSLEPKGLE